MPPLEPLEVKIEVTGVQQFKQLCAAFQRYVDEVESVEGFLRTVPTQNTTVAADQLLTARRDFQALLDEVKPDGG